MAFSEHLPDVQVFVRIPARTLDEVPDEGEDLFRGQRDCDALSEILSRTTTNYVILEPTDSDLSYSLKLDFQEDFDFAEKGLLVQVRIDGKLVGQTVLEQHHVNTAKPTSIRFKGPFRRVGKKLMQHHPAFQKTYDCCYFSRSKNHIPANVVIDDDSEKQCDCYQQTHWHLLDKVGDIVLKFFRCSVPARSRNIKKDIQTEVIFESDKPNLNRKNVNRLMKCTCEDAVDARNLRTITHFTT